MKIEIGNGHALRDWVSAWNDGDQDRWIALADDYDIWSNLDDSFPHPYTRKDAEEWVALQSAKDRAEHFAICDAAGPIGGIGVNTQRGDSTNSAELGYFVGKPLWGRGIATAAAKAGDGLWLRYGRPHPHLRKGQDLQRRIRASVGESRLPARGVTWSACTKRGRARGLSDVRHVARGLA